MSAATELRVIGAGLPRTGTTSLKAALEQLLGGRCYHMFELFDDLDAGLLWWQALDGDLDSLRTVLGDCTAAIDWPAALFWRELIEIFPDALVVLSHRESADVWWQSVDRTVWAMMRLADSEQAFPEFNVKMRTKAGLGDDWDTPAVAKQCYLDLYDEVVAVVPSERLVLWQASDGWSPLCNALELPEPDGDFFHLNTSAEFRSHAGLEST